MLLFYFYEYYKRNSNRSVTYGLIVLGFLAFLFLIYGDVSQISQSSSRNLFVGVPAFLFLNSMLLLEGALNSESRFMKLALKLGDASYAMYLFHPFIIFSLQRVIFARLKLSPSFVIQFLALLISLGIVCLVSILIYDFVDRPLMKLFKKKKKVQLINDIPNKVL